MKATLLLLLFVASASGRIHRLKLEDDSCRVLTVSTFGFLRGGTLAVNITHFTMTVSGTAASGTAPKFGFTLDKSKTNGLSSYMEEMQETCILENPDFNYLSHDSVNFTFDFKQNKLLLHRVGNDMQRLVVSDQPRHHFLIAHKFLRRNSNSQSIDSSLGDVDFQAAPFLISSVEMSRTADGGYQTYFLVSVQRPEEEGLYSLYFHNCASYYRDGDGQVTMTLEITEDNNGNFLTAGKMPVPALYFTFSIVFFIAGVAWLSVLRQSREDVYKIHYMMLVVVFVKSLACLFHGVNMYFIQIYGIHEDFWAVMWYIIRLTQGMVMLVTVLLMGAGWSILKSQLTRREKVVLFFVVSLQLLYQVATVIVVESEEGEAMWMTWKEVAILVDLLCCGAILFPVAWTLRSLKPAADTEGKAVVRPQIRKLFKHFYILIVVYIYVTRIVVYLLTITLPFRLLWVTYLCWESSTLLFFLLCGIRFRPVSDNAYMPVPQDSDSAYIPVPQDSDKAYIPLTQDSGYDDTEMEMDEVLTEMDKTEDEAQTVQQPEGATS